MRLPAALGRLFEDLRTVLRTRSLNPLRTPRALGGPLLACLLGTLPAAALVLLPALALGTLLGAQALGTGTRDLALESWTLALLGIAACLPLGLVAATALLGTLISLALRGRTRRDVAASLALGALLMPGLAFPGLNLVVLAAWPLLTGLLLARLGHRPARQGLLVGLGALLIGLGLMATTLILALATWLDRDLHRRTLQGPPALFLPEPPTPPPSARLSAT